MLQYSLVKKILLFVLSFTFVTQSPMVFAQADNFSQERLTGFSVKYKVSLDDNRINAIKKNCDSTKTTLKGLQITTDSAVRKRLLVYSDIQKELKALEIRLSRQGADASEIDLMIGKLQQELNQFNEYSQAHSDVVLDLVSIDCKEKPELFAAGIYELRSLRDQMQNSAEQLKNTVNESKETTFNPLVDRLIL